MVRTSILCAALSVSWLAACNGGGEAVPPPEYPAPAAPEPGTEGEPLSTGQGENFTTLEQAEAALARAEQELLALSGPAAASAGAPAAAPSTAPAQEAPAAPPPPPAPPASRAEAESEKKADETAPQCPSMCRAFASLARAGDAVCRLAGEGGDRCTRARSSVRTHFQRVASCRCKLGG